MEDVLSDVLRAVRLSGAVFFHFDATAPWSVVTASADLLSPFLRPGVANAVQLHAIASGSCWITVGDTPVEVHAGDLLVVPQGEEHVMASARGMPGQRMSIQLDPNARMPMPVKIGPERGPRTEIICGYLGCERLPFNPLLGALPRTIVVRHEPDRPALVQTLVDLALAQAKTPVSGRDLLLTRLSEAMFVEAIRRYVASAPAEHGWLAGVHDALVGRALAALHARPQQAWTLESLAHEAAASRSVLADRFNELVGMPPMQYLGQWRMQLAAELLDGSNASLAEISERVGYASEAALSRAFKRIVGQSPAQWRQDRRAQPSAYA